MIEKIVTLVLMFASAIFLLFLFGLFAELLERKQRLRMKQIMEEDPPSQLSGPIDLSRIVLKDEVRAEYQEKIKEVCVIRITYGSGGSKGGENLHTKYQGFVIETNGATQTFIENKQHHVVVQRAKHLATVLEVPFRDSSYGG